MMKSVLAAIMATGAATAMATCASPRVAIAPSGPITVTSSGQIIQNLDITTTDTTPGITCHGMDNVVIKNVRITHNAQGRSGHRTNGQDASQGINFFACNNIRISNVRVQLVGHPSGALPFFQNYNIAGLSSTGVVIEDVILSGGSSGVWLDNCVKPRISNWAAYNVQGPFPKGQCVQLGRCTGSIVENFICKNQWNYAWPEDSMSMWRSANSTVRNGVILGNNAPTGVSLMFEQSTKLDNSWGLAENIQVGFTGSGFSTYGGTHITFKSVSIKDNHCDGKGGRAPPGSGGLMFYAGAEQGVSSSNIVCDHCDWHHTCDINKVGRPVFIYQDMRMNPNAWVKKHLHEVDFTLNEHPIQLEICFMVGGEYVASTITGENVGLQGDGSVQAATMYEGELAAGTAENTPTVVFIGIFGIVALASVVALVTKRMSRNKHVQAEAVSESMYVKLTA